MIAVGRLCRICGWKVAQDMWWVVGWSHIHFLEGGGGGRGHIVRKRCSDNPAVKVSGSQKCGALNCYLEFYFQFFSQKIIFLMSKDQYLISMCCADRE